ncbi:hypothetical protein HGG82_15315 [Marinomonas sp. M1K-6]|uniref:CDP-glycerol--glycerophosphate glycerophosphotransferase n=1 Tax=Marinomonas profundi TaxID=2726122 RepID=A0A847RAA7_9GAMM|nr:CDP-glycerol glycerophosphotransferase family protein [Marinomonas profundi]NLQ18976.1 hypothetical protein [Marinomonas profundi]UDV04192.1 CDP-glycerol glycerophosphotransferase family protein [Marinomonas profundi]
MLRKIFRSSINIFKQLFNPLKVKLLDNPRKRKLAQHMQHKHQQLLSSIKGKEKIKVVFLAIHKSVWKVDPVFRKMLEDPYFEPEILVCPYTLYGEERMLEDMDKTFTFFKEKGYPVLKSLNSDGTWLGLSEIKPDIVFFTNPHNLTRKEYYEDAYLNYLSCYVPYFYLVTSHGNDQSLYNHLFHNLMWKIFMPHSDSMNLARVVSSNDGMNCVLTGYPACESLFENNLVACPWKKAQNKFKIIYAPHHTIENAELQLSNFLIYAELMLDLVDSYKENVQWAFKPHPILKSKLYNHPDWGKEKTDKYYRMWSDGECSQLDEGEYDDLFISSDAIIHDCGSFLAEYLYLKKPVLYLLNPNTRNNLNGFGLSALACCKHGVNKLSIINFVDFVIDNNRKEVDNAPINNFHDVNIKPFFSGGGPSDKIINELRMLL